MKLSQDTINILDKFYDYVSDDSSRILSIDKDMEIESEKKDSAQVEIKALEEKARNREDLYNHLKLEQVVKFLDLIALEDSDLFSLVFKHISSESSDIENLSTPTLEDIRNSVKNDINTIKNNLREKTEIKKEADLAIKELEIKKNMELENQKNLRGYKERALSFDNQLSRGELTAVFSQFDFNEEEINTLVALFILPENGLIAYDDMRMEKVLQDEASNKKISSIIQDALTEDTIAIDIVDPDEIETISIEDVSDEIGIEPVIDEKPEENVIEQLRDLGIDAHKFKDPSIIEELTADFNLDTVKENITALKDFMAEV